MGQFSAENSRSPGQLLAEINSISAQACYNRLLIDNRRAWGSTHTMTVPFDVYDDGSIRSYLAGFSDDPATARLLVLCLERALRKGPDGLREMRELPPDAPGWLRTKFGEGVAFHRFAPDAALDARVRHVADWIGAAVVNNEPSLADTDGEGRPKKLLKIGSLARAEAEADKDMRRFAFKAAASAHTDGEGEESVMTFPDGSRIVRLLTPEALDRESGMMGHCVGRGSYDKRLKQEKTIIYSLRDREGNAHVTFEARADGNKLLQCTGKQNAPPAARYMPQVRAFIESRGFVLKEPRYTGLVQDAEGRLHSITALPEGLEVGGDLDLGGTAITALPDGLKVGGDLFLAGPGILDVPRGPISSFGARPSRPCQRALRSAAVSTCKTRPSRPCRRALRSAAISIWKARPSRPCQRALRSAAVSTWETRPSRPCQRALRSAAVSTWETRPSRPCRRALRPATVRPARHGHHRVIAELRSGSKNLAPRYCQCSSTAC